MRTTPDEDGDGASNLLLERDDEVTALAAAIHRAAGGEGGVVLVRGAAGMGKTRLLDVAAGLASDAGMDVQRARGGALEREFPFGVVLGLFETRVRTATREERAVAMEGSAALAAPMLLGIHASERALRDLREASLIHALQWLAVNLGTVRPLALVVDDLHWADPPSLRFLAYLAARVHELPVLLVAATRPREPGAEHELLAQLGAAPEARVLAPQGLSVAATATLVRHGVDADGDGTNAERAGVDRRNAGQDQEVDAFTRACFEATGGNPLLLRELLRALSAEGRGGSDTDVDRVHELGPEPVARSVRSTLGRLGPDEGAITAAIAVLGRDAGPSAVAALAGLPADAAATAASRLQDAGMLAATDELRFAHPMLRQVVYDDIAPATRGRMHRRAAELLHRHGHALAVAGHLLLAPGAGEAWAVDALRTAADEAEGRTAHATAARLLRRAAEEPPPTDLPLALAEAALAGARAEDPDARETLEVALAAADERHRAPLLLALAKVWTRQGDAAEAMAACDRGLAGPGVDETLRHELEAAWAAAALWTTEGSEQVARRLASTLAAERPVRTQGERELVAGLSAIELIRGTDRDATLALARRAWGDGAYLAEGTCDASALGPIVSALLRSGALAECLEALDALIADARRRAARSAYAQWRTARGSCLLHLGRLEEAESDLDEALGAHAVSRLAVLPFAVDAQVSVLLERGEPARARAVLDVARAAESSFAGNSLWSLVHAARGRLAMAEGDPGTAREELLVAGRIATDVVGTSNPAVLPWRSEAALATRRLGDLAEAARLAAAEVQDARRFGAPRPLSIALRVQAVVVGGAEGIALAGEAVDLLEGTEVALEHCRALVTLGTLLRAAGKRTDARAALGRGLDAAGALGARALAAEAREELLAAGARPRRERTRGPDSLTAGERRASRLAARGLSNRAIADALFVTPKAVSFHLSNAYRKLEIRGRDQLAAVLGPEEPAETLVPPPSVRPVPGT
ncbi:ATP-binding protein [Patulibacter americanus]|uniref:ATP-binding protein n=1 Tax=Patulibacter americanus TaxID=588672 RepID=UPI0003B64AEB|nr:LuxR family transcriptional regulator [Patulibacter americanus]